MVRYLLELSVGVGLLLSGCRKAEESPEAGLEEMGYSVTAADFHRAAEIGDVAVMETLLEKGMDLDARDGVGNFGLHAAAAAGSEAGVRFFVDQGMDVDVRGASERTPLMVAAAEDELAAVRELLRLGAKAELVDANGFRALTIAADVGSADAIDGLAVSSRPFLDDALLLSCLRGHSECVAVLTDYGASVYARMGDGMTPLMLAAREGHVETIEVLLERGANRFAVDDEERTAGQVASAAGHGLLAIRLNAAPGENAFELPALPGWDAGEEPVVDGALLGAVIGHQEEETPEEGEGHPSEGALVGGSLGGGAGYVVGGDEGEPRDGEGDPGLGEGDPEVTQEQPLGGAVIGSVPIEEDPIASKPGERKIVPDEPASGLVMARYEEKPLPLRIEGADEGEVQVRYLYGEHKRVTVKKGEEIPLTGLRVVEVEKKRDHSKLTGGVPADVSVVVVEDPATGQQRRLTVKLGASAHEPFAVLRNGKAGKPMVVRSGAVVQGVDGQSYRVIDVRPAQVVIENVGSGEATTLNLQKK